MTSAARFWHKPVVAAALCLGGTYIVLLCVALLVPTSALADEFN